MTVGAPKFNAEIFGQGNNVRLKVNSNIDEDASVRVFGLDGRLIFGENYKISPGENDFSFNPGKLATGVYIVDYTSKSGRKTAKIVSGFDNGITGGTLEGIVKSGMINNWTFELSHPRLLSKKILVPYSSSMILNASLDSRPTVFLKAIDVFTRKSEYGILKNLSEMTPVPNLDVVVGSTKYGKTGSNGEFSFRPDTLGDFRIKVIDNLEKFYSKWYDVNLAAGKKDTIRDFKAEAVFMVENYVDNLVKRLVEAFWDIGDFKNRYITQFAWVGFYDDTLEKGVYVDPVFKDGKHVNGLIDINKQIANFHISGLPKLFEADENNSYIYIHYGGTLLDGTIKWTYRQNEEGLYYKIKADISIGKTWADIDEAGVLYALLEHELDRVYFAYLQFPEKQYVMYIYPIGRWHAGYSTENSPLEDKILGLVVNGPAHLQLHNNFLLTDTLNFPGYEGTKSAKLKSANIKEMEKIFSGADKVEFGKDRLGNFVTVTYNHKN